jgi:hypothetical protein
MLDIMVEVQVADFTRSGETKKKICKKSWEIELLCWPKNYKSSSRMV